MKRISFILTFFLFMACNLDSPDRYVGKAVLNTTLLGYQFGFPYFEHLSGLRSSGNLKIYENKEFRESGSFVEYLEKVSIPEIAQKYEDIKALKRTEEAGPMLDASIDLFQFALDYMRTDYKAIAQMMDEGVPNPEIERAIYEFEQAKGPVFDEKYDLVGVLGKKYADDNGVDLNID
ncbi:MAG: hypothetical protein ACK5IC_00675 [Moheibacter sp.]